MPQNEATFRPQNRKFWRKFGLDAHILDIDPMKQQIIEAVRQVIAERMANAQTAMQAAQESANSETKSSAGDKYETGRAMGQLDRNMYAQQYEQARQEMVIVARLADNPTLPPPVVVVGALVKTTGGVYWLAVSIGKITIDNQDVMVVSPQTPVGKLLLDKKVGDLVKLMSGSVTIEAIS